MKPAVETIETRVAAAALCGLLLSGWIAGQASAQFRTHTPIASPKSDARSLPDNALPVAKVVPVPREIVEPQLERIIAVWNTPAMAQTLADEFFDRTRLLDAVDTEVPRDAKLRFQSLQAVQTLQQYRVPEAAGQVSRRVSIVSATARTQLEFNSATGLVRLPGTNEFIMRVTQPEPGK